jgi:hypothetical protein
MVGTSPIRWRHENKPRSSGELATGGGVTVSVPCAAVGPLVAGRVWVWAGGSVAEEVGPLAAERVRVWVGTGVADGPRPAGVPEAGSIATPAAVDDRSAVGVSSLTSVGVGISRSSALVGTAVPVTR